MPIKLKSNKEDIEKKLKGIAFKPIKKIEPAKKETNKEEIEEESSENLIPQTPFISKTRKASLETNPFLTSEPIQNLERSMQEIPKKENTRVEEQKIVYNEPEYGLAYAQGRDSYISNIPQIDMTGGAIKPTRESQIGNIQTGSRRQTRQEGEQYSAHVETRERDERLPFQRKKGF